MIRSIRIFSLVLAVVLFATTALQAQYVIEQTVKGGYNAYIKGQTFTPSIGIVPDPGAVTTLDLTSIKLYRSMQGWAGPTSEFYLNIYDGDPVNGTGTFVGSSSNTIDVALMGDKTPMKWTFNYLSLDYTHEYWALVSSTDTAGGLDVYCGMRECGPDNYPGGNAIAGNSSDPGGFNVKSNDLAFKIELADVHTLTADATTLTESAGTINLEIDFGSAYAGRTYLLAASISGTEPGTVLPGGEVLPINWDFVSDLCITYNNIIWFHDFWGTLDGEGKAAPRFEWPGYAGSTGLVFDFAACTAMPYDFVTNPWTVSVYDPTPPTKELYVAYKNSSDNFFLGKINYANPESVQSIGAMGQKLIRAMEFAGDGKLYAYESLLWGSSRLYRVNPTNATLTPIGPAGNNRVDGMAYNPVDDKMYGVDATTSMLFQINLTTGGFSNVGTLSDDGPVAGRWIGGIAFDDEGYLYAYNNSASSVVSEQGVYRSSEPGGLELEMIYDLRAEFGIYGTPYSLQTPAPLFMDWSSGDKTCYGWLREWDVSQITGWYGYHLNPIGIGWTKYPPSPSQYKIIYAWTAPPSP